jgi:hypothetical protein
MMRHQLPRVQAGVNQPLPDIASAAASHVTGKRMEMPGSGGEILGQEAGDG